MSLAKRIAITSITLCSLAAAAIIGCTTTPAPQTFGRSAGATVDVTDFGAIGDGTTDDSAAFQRAVDALEGTGGEILLPVNRLYVVKDVIIQGRYPITFSSAMGSHEVAGGALTNNDKASIRPASGASFIFKWDRDASAFPTTGFSAGGGLQGIAFNDIDTAGTNARGRTISTAAVWIKDATNFTMRDCRFEWLKGTCLRVEESVYTILRSCLFKRCGDTAKPVVYLGDATFSGVYTDRVFIENNYSTHVKVGSDSIFVHNNFWHEQIAGTDAPYIDSTGATTDYIRLDGGTLQQNTETFVILDGDHPLGHVISNTTMIGSPGSNHMIDILADADDVTLQNLTLYPGNPHTGRAINCASLRCRMTDIKIIEGGGIYCSQGEHYLANIEHIQPRTAAGTYDIDLGDAGAAYSVIHNVTINGQGISQCNGIEISNCSLTGAYITRLDGSPTAVHSTNSNDIIGNCRVTEIDTGTAFSLDQAIQFWGNYSDSGSTHSTRVTAILPVPLSSLVQIADGIRPTEATDPTLEDDSNNVQRMVWTAGNTDGVYVTVPLPQGFDGTRDVTVTLTVNTDNTGGGGVDAATFTVASTWDNGTPVTNTATDSSPSTGTHGVTATIAAADITDGAQMLTLLLTPGTHANDPVRLYNVRVATVATLNSVQ